MRHEQTSGADRRAGTHGMPSPRRCGPDPATDDAAGFRQVLAETSFPAARWLLVAEASHWGATPTAMAWLSSLPDGVYDSLDHLIGHLMSVPRPRTRRGELIEALRAARVAELRS